DASGLRAPVDAGTGVARSLRPAAETTAELAVGSRRRNRTGGPGSPSSIDMDAHPVLAIEAKRLVKRFGATTAVDGIDLKVRTGTVYGVLGPNGAGKTTTIRMLATLLRPSEGSAYVLGHDVVAEAAAVRGRVSLTG